MGVLHIVILLFIGWILVLANKFVMALMQNFRVSWDQINRWRVAQTDFNWKSIPPHVAAKLSLAVLYIILRALTQP
jgi:hypothetical protein